jgi:hypothetical protein
MSLGSTKGQQMMTPRQASVASPGEIAQDLLADLDPPGDRL